MTAFKHRPKLGDVIFSLPLIRAMGGGTLYLDPVSPHFRGEEAVWTVRFTQLADYIRKLPYITDCRVWDGEPFRYDLDDYMNTSHLTPGDRAHIVENHFRGLGVEYSPERDLQPWLSLTKACPEIPHIYARSIHHHPDANYKVHARSAFVGTELEHRGFVGRFGAVERMLCPTIEDLVNLIGWCGMFHGNQSLPHAVAVGFRKKREVELRPDYPNGAYGTSEETIMVG